MGEERVGGKGREGEGRGGKGRGGWVGEGRVGGRVMGEMGGKRVNDTPNKYK